MITIDGNFFIDKKSTFDYLNEIFEFEYEVLNLDALNDCLSLIDEEIHLINFRKIYENLGNYGKKIIELFVNLVLFEDKNINFYS